MATWSQIHGTIDSVIVQSSWLGVKTPWIIFKPVLSEGTISLFITLTSALSLTCFYYIYKTFSTMDTYSNDNYKEQLSKMEIAYLVFSGIKRLFQAYRIVPLPSLFRFSSRLGLPILVYILTTMISGICQSSVHSTKITHQSSEKVSITASNLTDLVMNNHVVMNNGEKSLYNPTIAQSTITNKDYQTGGFFVKNGSFCSGSSNPNLSFKTKDATVCENLPFTILADLSIFSVNTNSSAKLQYFSSGGVDVQDAGVVPWAVDVRTGKSLNQMYYYVGLSGYSLGSSYKDLSSFNFGDSIEGFISGSKNLFNFSVWSGTCNHQIQFCDAEFSMGDLRFGVCSDMVPYIPNVNFIGVGTALRNHFTLRIAMSTIQSSFPSLLPGTQFLGKSLGLISFASYLSLQRLSSVNMTSIPATYFTTYSEDGIAMDLITTVLLMLFLTLTLGVSILLLCRSRRHEHGIQIARRRIGWDPVTRLASELSQKNNLGFDHGYWEIPENQDPLYVYLDDQSFLRKRTTST